MVTCAFGLALALAAAVILTELFPLGVTVRSRSLDEAWNCTGSWFWSVRVKLAVALPPAVTVVAVVGAAKVEVGGASSVLLTVIVTGAIGWPSGPLAVTVKVAVPAVPPPEMNIPGPLADAVATALL